ncbi:MAG: HNH endonuclease [Deltaproteobacteria bacterium]|nr:HNH endonuclease [Deltaproteobacteria bacterium]
MKSFDLKLFSLKNTSVLKLESTTTEIDDIVFCLLSIFAKEIDNEKHRITVEALQRKTEKLVEDIQDFVDIHKTHAPAIYKLKKFIDVIDDNEYFYVFQNTKLDTDQIIKISNQLLAINESKDFDKLNSSIDDVFGYVLDNYNMFPFMGDKPTNVGEPNKKKRVCRFCHKRYPDVTFKKKAHAISESLGNKSIVANEECDSCNEKFGNGIENDIIYYLSVHRSFFGIKGKESDHPKLKGKNFSIKKSIDQTINFEFVGEDGDGGFPHKIDAHANEKICLQNIYRVLCKYAISVITPDALSSLKKTIAWINEEYTPDQLPKVKVQLIYSFFSEQPSITIYHRKTNIKETPHIIGEFRFAYFVFIFVVPFSSQDDKRFVSKEEFEGFWKKFYYSQGEVGNAWRTMNLSDSERRQLVFNIKFETENNV